jgi:hypothetical protein
MNTLNPLNSPTSQRGRLLRMLAAPLTAAALMALPTSSMAGVFLSVDIAPPPIPVYEQPPIPGDGYMWTPGYWAYGDDGYFWVPGTWVQPPTVGVLWTPGYWGWSGGFYAFHEGYWGPHIGFYGGINYGWGYGGFGYEGGYWNHGGFYYNRGVNNFGGAHVNNVYNKEVVNNNANHTSFNGGTEGVAAKPTAQEMAVEHEQHTPPVDDQKLQVQAASHDQAMYASANHGAPAVAATARPGGFRGAGVVQAHPVSAQDREAVGRAEQAHAVDGATGKPINTGYNRSGAGRGNGYNPRQANQRPGGGYQPARGVGPQGLRQGAPLHTSPKGAPAAPAKGDDKDHR